METVALTSSTVSIQEAEALTQSWQDRMIPPAKARALTNRFILENLRDGFCAGLPRYLLIHKEPAWAVPLMFTPPAKPPGEVGEVLIHALQAVVVGFTPPAEVYRNAKSLRA